MEYLESCIEHYDNTKILIPPNTNLYHASYLLKSMIDCVQTNDYKYDDMNVTRYCAGYDYDPITGESNCISWVEGSKDDEVVISGVSLFGGLEYPINKFIINIGYGISYFPDVDNSDMEKLLSLYVLGFYYSFASEN